MAIGVKLLCSVYYYEPVQVPSLQQAAIPEYSLQRLTTTCDQPSYAEVFTMSLANNPLPARN